MHILCFRIMWILKTKDLRVQQKINVLNNQHQSQVGIQKHIEDQYLFLLTYKRSHLWH